MSALYWSTIRAYKTHMNPACNYWGSLSYYSCKDGVKLKEYQSALHPTWRREGEILGKKEEIRLNKYRGGNSNAANYIERFRGCSYCIDGHVYFVE